jgi:hypothetical protein
MLFAILSAALLLIPQTAQASVGPRIKIHPHVDTATYSKPLHEVRGRIGIVNTTRKAVTVRCTVVATLHSKTGSAVLKGSAIVKTTVGPDRTKQPHYGISLRDKHHRFRNFPSHLGAHCQKV